ncbi:MAG: polysaccharide biosynthesis/export family protein [Acidobacteriota bacterium]|nr:polysaccharide biosynthesis/export family protein [Acidobacteriota bacterium]MDQ7088129.1 polysaccharide biosynthesis/export family protein [Acidobacteriota bacterium]
MRHTRLVALLALFLFSAAPAQNSAPVTPGSNSTKYDYVIGAYDLVEIQVFELQQLTRKVRVAEDGTISLPLLGKITIGGLTPQEAEQHIGDLLREGDLVREPQVTVFVEKMVSRQITIQGAVKDPGPYPILGQKTLLDMIGEAGGLVNQAGNKIIILRPFATGGEDRIEIDAERLVFEGDPLTNILLHPGDIVMVPYLQQVRIYVNGAVRTPGAKEFPSDESITLLQAITAAGGTTDRANERRVTVIRRLEDGTKRMFKLNLKKIKKGRADDMVLEKNDIVYVPESIF